MGGQRSGKTEIMLRNFTVAEEDGKVNAETLESLAGRLLEILKDYKLKQV